MSRNVFQDAADEQRGPFRRQNMHPAPLYSIGWGYGPGTVLLLCPYRHESPSELCDRSYAICAWLNRALAARPDDPFPQPESTK